MANVELLQKTLQYIKDHPEEWNQSSWDCGTTACFAGWACRLAIMENETLFAEYGRYWEKKGWESSFPYNFIEQLAKDVLDIDHDDANNLFSSTNTLNTLEEIVNDIINK